MLTHPQAVLFDLDGTLLDTADDLGAALNFVLAKYNMPAVAREIFRPIASDGAKGLLELGFGDQLTQYDYEQLRVEFLDYYQANIAEHTRLYPGIAELINYLEQQSIPWGIVTNKPEGLTLALLPAFNELANCQVIVGGDSLAKRKPDPLPITHACQQIDADCDHTWYIGDAPRDIEAGNAANTTSIVAGWGYISNLADCQHWQAAAITLTAEELLMLIKQHR